jgi:hypothetical protein
MERDAMDRHTIRIFGAVVFGLSLLAFGAPTQVSAEEKTCRGTLGAQTFDNLRVPDGATCTLNGTKVKGTIKVETRATLYAFGVRVIGNIQAENSRKVVVHGSRIGGSVKVVQSGIAKVRGNRINGNILFDDNSGLNVARRNIVGADIQAFQNTGGVRIYYNRVDGNLQCKANSPRPVGDGNIVQGVKQDQCRGF